MLHPQYHALTRSHHGSVWRTVGTVNQSIKEIWSVYFFTYDRFQIEKGGKTLHYVTKLT